jgi:hypothetical protein
MVLNHIRQNLVAYVALAVALSTGTAYAADQIASGSVTTSKLAKDAVTSSKIKKDTIKGSDLRDGNASGADLKDGSVTGADVTDGSLGGVDVTDESLTGADVLDGSIGAADLAANAAPRFAAAWAQVLAAADPAAVAEGAIEAYSFTLPRAGRVYVSYNAARFAFNCSAGTANAGLYVNGVALPGTGIVVPSTTDPNQPLHLAKVGNLPAGTHEMTVGVDCPGGGLAGGGQNDRVWTVLLLSD